MLADSYKGLGRRNMMGTMGRILKKRKRGGIERLASKLPHLCNRPHLLLQGYSKTQPPLQVCSKMRMPNNLNNLNKPSNPNLPNPQPNPPTSNPSTCPNPPLPLPLPPPLPRAPQYPYPRCPRCCPPLKHRPRNLQPLWGTIYNWAEPNPSPTPPHPPIQPS